MSKTPIINMPSVSRQLTIEQEKSLQSGNGNIGIYLKGLQTKIIDDKISKKEKNMFSSTLFLLNWLNKNTNIDMLGLKEILNGAYTVIKDDNEHQLEICPMVFLDCKRKYPWYTTYGYPGILRVNIYPTISSKGLTEKDIPILQQKTFDLIYDGLNEDPEQMAVDAIKVWKKINKTD